MADKSNIEWTDATWNPVTGCSVVSPGCTNCYAMKLAGGRLREHPTRKGLTVAAKAGPVWTGEVRFNERQLLEPLKWSRPRMIFVCAHGDLFHESVPDEWIDKVFAVMALARQHTFQVLTKRAKRMREYVETFCDGRRHVFGEARDIVGPSVALDALLLEGEGAILPLANVWLAVSAEDQPRADERIPELLATPAAIRFLSAEPLIGPVDIRRFLVPIIDVVACGLEDDPLAATLLQGSVEDGHAFAPLRRRLDWVIVGGESQAGARPMHPDWARWIRDDCVAAGVPFFFKQWGDWTPGENVERQRGVVETAHWFNDRWDFGEESLASTDGHIDDEPDIYRIGKRAAGRRLDGRTWDERPGPPVDAETPTLSKEAA